VSGQHYATANFTLRKKSPVPIQQKNE